MSVFKTIPKADYIHETESFFLVYDKFPVSPGHILIITKEDRIDYFELTDHEQKELTDLILKAKELISQEHQPDGYNIGMNCGKSAGQTVMHFHCHVIPRYVGDMDKPDGGIRHCVSGKGYY